MVQLVTRVDDTLAGAIDQLVASGRFGSRSDVVRAGVAELVDRLRREEIGRQIIAGYERLPETEAEIAGDYAAAKAMIEEEPW